MTHPRELTTITEKHDINQFLELKPVIVVIPLLRKLFFEKKLRKIRPRSAVHYIEKQPK